jgi:hypothetical protein
MKYCLDGIQMLQGEAKDIDEINPSRANNYRTMPTDDLECVSHVERVNNSGKDGGNIGYTRKFQGVDENQVSHMV